MMYLFTYSSETYANKRTKVENCETLKCEIGKYGTRESYIRLEHHRKERKRKLNLPASYFDFFFSYYDSNQRFNLF